MDKLFKALVGVAVLVAACSPDRAQDPLSVKPSFEEQSNPPPDDCDPMGDPRPECNPEPPPPQYIPYEVWFDNVETDLDLSASAYEEDPETAPCPRWIDGFLTATARDPHTGYFYSFPSSGRWTIDWVKSIPYLPSGQAIYNWPQGGGDGSWPAHNVSLGKGGAKIWVDEGRAFCAAVNNLHFFVFYGVRVEDPNIRRPEDGGGGGGGGAGGGGGTDPSDCTTEWVILEVDYGDGIWHTLWEGWARVCA